MSSFTEPLDVRIESTLYKGRGEYTVLKSFHYDVGHLGSDERITVPAGYKTDLCSAPWWATPFVPTAGPMAKPALIHDWLTDQNDPRRHDIFGEALAVAGVGRMKRWLMVAGVRLYAWWACRKVGSPDRG